MSKNCVAITIWLAWTLASEVFGDYLSWSESSYDELCDHSDSDSTGYVWMLADSEDCTITVHYYNPEEDIVTEDSYRSTTIGSWGFSVSENPNNAVIMNGIMYTIDYWSYVGYMNLSSSGQDDYDEDFIN